MSVTAVASRPADAEPTIQEVPRQDAGRQDDELDRLLEAACATTDPRARERILNEVVVRAMPIATSLARRYRTRGEPEEDLVQVAALALVKASRGFRPEHGGCFLAYAVPTISGELRRHFRDHGWMVRPPRRLQELQLTVRADAAKLSQSLGRATTPSEVSAELSLPCSEVREAMVAAEGYAATSLDAVGGRDGEPALADTVGDEDAGLDAVLDRLALEPLLAALPPRDRLILGLRFYGGWTQERIAAHIGVSQVQVSRLITRTLQGLRRQALEHAV